MTELKQTIEEQTKKLTDLEAEIDAVVKEIFSLEENNNKLIEEADLSERNQMALEEKLSEIDFSILDKEISELKDQSEKFKDRAVALELEIASTQEEIKQKRIEEGQQDDKFIQILNEIEQKEGELTQLNHQQEILMAESETARFEIESKNKELKKIESTIKSAKGEESKEINKLKDLEKSCEEFSSCKIELEYQKSILNGQLGELIEKEQIETEKKLEKNIVLRYKMEELQKLKDNISLLYREKEDDIKSKVKELEECKQIENRILQQTPAPIREQGRSTSPLSRSQRTPMNFEQEDIKRKLELQIESNKKVKKEFEEKLKESELIFDEAVKSASSMKTKGFIICMVGFAFGIILYRFSTVITTSVQ